MTDKERDAIETMLSYVAETITKFTGSGGARDLSTVGCMMTLCLAIREGREEELSKVVSQHFPVSDNSELSNLIRAVSI
jgi:hypothetical protein